MTLLILENWKTSKTLVDQINAMGLPFPHSRPSKSTVLHGDMFQSVDSI
jgi:hypothetical protein